MTAGDTRADELARRHLLVTATQGRPYVMLMMRIEDVETDDDGEITDVPVSLMTHEMSRVDAVSMMALVLSTMPEFTIDKARELLELIEERGE